MTSFGSFGRPVEQQPPPAPEPAPAGVVTIRVQLEMESLLAAQALIEQMAAEAMRIGLARGMAEIAGEDE